MNPRSNLPERRPDRSTFYHALTTDSQLKNVLYGGTPEQRMPNPNKDFLQEVYSEHNLTKKCLPNLLRYPPHRLSL